MKNLNQNDVILYAMIKNPSKEWWYAKDFQYGEYFVGYEATARMSELANKYPFIKRGEDGRFRILSLDWNYTNQINEQKERIEMIIELNEGEENDNK